MAAAKLAPPSAHSGMIGAGDRSKAGVNRVIRGGSWNNNGRNVRSAYRNRNAPDNRNNNLGFRLALAHHTVGMGVDDQIVIQPCGQPQAKSKAAGMLVMGADTPWTLAGRPPFHPLMLKSPDKISELTIMMINPAFEDFETLPPDAQQQVIDFIAFIKSRYQTRKDNKNKCDVESSFGAVKVKRKVTLEQMDEAIRQRGGEL